MEGSMRKIALVSFLVVLLPLLAVAPGEAWGHHWHGRVFIGFGPGFWWGAPYPYWGYPPPYAYAPPPVVVEEPPVYVQPPTPLPAAPQPQAEWYYCRSANAYYPSVNSCPEAWVKVPARSE
jgi:hypothetical protein